MMDIIYCVVFNLELSFVFAFDNLSYNKFAIQSHTYTGTGYDASNAVDGHTTTCTRTKDIGRTSPDKTVWWKVDLGEVYNKNRISILFKNYDGYENRQRGRFAGFSLYVSNTGVIEGSTLCYKDGPQLPPLNFTTTCTMYGRYVIFYNERLDSVTYPSEYELSTTITEICEVIVDGCEKPGMYGSFCNKTCPRNCKEVVCQVQNGDCFTCKPGWTGATCTNNNLSYNKFAIQSHTYTGTGYDASNAVDGHTTTCTRTKDIGRTSPDKTVWWKVDLGEVYNINRISILFKNYDGYENRQRGRFAGFSLYVSNTGVIEGSTLCYKDGPQLPPLNFTTTCTMYGRYVIFYNERLDSVTYPSEYELSTTITEICEVIVDGCEKPGMYGSFCNKTCPRNCKEVVCQVQNGDCFTCKPGWTGATCTNKCTDRWYGLNCSHQCVGHCKDSFVCNHVTGLCPGGCDAGWTGYMCVEACNGGVYGYDCVNNCSGHCLNNSPCNKQTGHCDMGCDPGYTNPNCNEECPSGQFGLDCKERCSGHCLNSEPCDHVSGVCFSGCQDGYTGSRCNKFCCEGYYGRNCSKICSPNCKICRRTDGLCSCNAGWSGPRCTEECYQSYGENCQYPCNTNCINRICDKFNGTCLFGCLNGRTCDLGGQQNAETNDDDISCPPWIIAFSIAMVIIIIFVIATIRLWRTSINRNSNTGCVQSRRIQAFGESQVGLSDDASHYQELSVSKEHNTYQTLTL